MTDDYYKVLGVNRNASAADIQKAYRDLARKHHPDANPNDKTAKERFQKIQQAYDVLNDPQKREMYDRYGSSFDAAGGGPWRAYSGGGHPGFEEIDLGQIFGDQAFGGGFPEGGFADFFQVFTGGRPQGRQQRKPRPSRGPDLQHRLDVPFNTAIKGGEARITVQRPSGKTESISVKIPAGIEDGKKIRLRGQGEPAPRGGQAGDIIITVHVAAHPHFRRRGNDLEVDLPLSLAEAALGAKVDVPTPQGTISLTVAAGTSSGKRLRIPGHGVQSQETKGDLYVQIQIVLPASIDAESTNLVRKFALRNPQNPRADLKW